MSTTKKKLFTMGKESTHIPEELIKEKKKRTMKSLEENH